VKFIVIGGSAAGVNAVETLRRLNTAASIELVSEEQAPIYSRSLLPHYLSGRLARPRLNYRPDGFYRELDVTAHIGVRATKIDPASHRVQLNDGSQLSYDRLLLATGARSKMPDIPGRELPGIFALRDLSDALRIEERARESRSAVILGGGLVGLKAAHALKLRGLHVTVVVKSGRLLSQMLDPQASEIFDTVLGENGIDRVSGREAAAFEGRGSVEAVLLDDDSRIEAGIVVIGKGVTPNKELLEEAGGETGEGILVDRSLQTSIESVYAAGDVIETRDRVRAERRVNALWPCAVEQAVIAASNMSGRREAYSGSMSMNSLEFFGLPVISQGIVSGKAPEYREVQKSCPGSRTYRKLVYRGNRVVGMVFVNAIDNAGVVGELIRSEADASSISERILEDDFSLADILPLVRGQKDKFPGWESLFPSPERNFVSRSCPD
jgi:nitrite reductase (NADH) large subunit